MGTAFRKSDASDVRVPCNSVVEAGDYVYIGDNNIADLADASDKNKMPCVGYVLKKDGLEVAIITQFYLDNGLEDVENKRNYFISDEVAGSIQDEQPVGKDTVSQVVAQGVGTTSLLISVDPASAVINNK